MLHSTSANQNPHNETNLINLLKVMGDNFEKMFLRIKINEEKYKKQQIEIENYKKDNDVKLKEIKVDTQNNFSQMKENLTEIKIDTQNNFSQIKENIVESKNEIEKIKIQNYVFSNKFENIMKLIYENKNLIDNKSINVSDQFRDLQINTILMMEQLKQINIRINKIDKNDDSYKINMLIYDILHNQIKNNHDYLLKMMKILSEDIEINRQEIRAFHQKFFDKETLINSLRIKLNSYNEYTDKEKKN